MKDELAEAPKLLPEKFILTSTKEFKRVISLKHEKTGIVKLPEILCKSSFVIDFDSEMRSLSVAIQSIIFERKHSFEIPIVMPIQSEVLHIFSAWLKRWNE